jgi:hypothetical protein
LQPLQQLDELRASLHLSKVGVSDKFAKIPARNAVLNGWHPGAPWMAGIQVRKDSTLLASRSPVLELSCPLDESKQKLKMLGLEVNS